MKKFFRNENGTLKVINVVVLVDIIVAVILLSIVKNIFGTLTNMVDIKRTTAAVTKTSNVNLCNGCKVTFNRRTFNVIPNQEYALEEILNLEKVNMKYVNFEISNPELASITYVDEKLTLKVSDTIGEFKLKATYYSESDEIDVVISTEKLMDIKFDQSIYYVKVNGVLGPKYELIPKRYDAPKETIKIVNEDVATVDENGTIFGKKLGKTSYVVSCDGLTKSVPLYVVNSHVTVKVKHNFLFRDLEYVTYDRDSTEDNEILLQLENTDLTYNNVTYEVLSDDNMTVKLEYIKKNTEFANSYEYRVKIGCSEQNIMGPRGGATIIFTLTDGSKKEFRIEQKEE